MKKILKHVALIVIMISLGASAFTSLAGWQDTPFEYNAYLQGFVSLCIFLYEMRNAINWGAVRIQKPVTNARDKK